jgi:hypothetical protein
VIVRNDQKLSGKLAPHLNPNIEIFEDVQFRPFSPAR